jgi:uncharacterized repeat protein (TIGR02543 family)
MVFVMASISAPSIASASSTPAFYSVNFLQNDSLTDQTNAEQTENTTTPLTLFAALNPSFANPGYVFNDWSTTPSNSAGSTTYSDGEDFSFTSGPVLYAQWTPNIYTLSYIPSGGVVSPTSENYTVGTSPLVLLAPTFNGYVFQGWNTAPGGTGTTYAAGASYTPITNVTLYAQWTLAPVPPVTGLITIAFVANGAGGAVPSATAAAGSSVTLPTGAALTFSGHTFAGWNTNALGTGTNYLGSTSYVVTSSLFLYAQWTVISGDVVTFAPNGGVGAVTAINGQNGTAVTLPGGTGLSYVGHTFASWNTAADGSGTVLNVNSALLLANSVTLYAQWDALLTVKSPNVLVGAVGSFAVNSSRLTKNLKTQVLRLALFTKSSHFAAETMYGYTNDTGSVSSQVAVSTRRANAVANYLRVMLASLHVNGVKITSAGEGAFKTGSTSSFRRVEIFVKG